MDELIAKLRSQVSETQKNVQTDNSQTQSSLNDDVLVIKNENELPEITTSQSDILPKNRFKLDFDILKKYRGENSMKISELKLCDLLKIDGPVWAIVKSIESYKGINGCVHKWELMDESGVIFASSIVSDQSISVGSIICISDFSVWNMGGNHLNIVDRNIKRILN
ncbi:uncharacterized protein VICG_01464 [Vittaforma corneae ATCC 50505]|uniref:OB domain-containing protein n=1 Tax=Vittaforma corneae (strain ATCC 50505) TaxID=993615 RepID=L2GLU7_VITCO|nr:uncharacterized protein VICG_01464 [Vittaforma corneae ATCC 50505]ELA41480.1 hypothetical protein VICG_01464 [Vittaforma corneae ATCC 50505]